MMKKWCCLFFALLIISLLCGCNDSSAEPTSGDTSPTYAELDEKGFFEMEHLLETGYNSGDIRNFYYETQIVAPNPDLTPFDVNGETYYLSVYRYGKGRAAAVYDDENGKPDRFIEWIYYTQPISTKDLQNAKTAGEVYALADCADVKEFAYNLRDSRAGFIFEPSAEERTALCLTDDGFCFVNFEECPLYGTDDGIELKKDCKVTSVEKCQPEFHNKLYELINKTL